MDLDTLQRIPTSPGVYLMKDKKGLVIYVGKAKDLRARVRAYFREGGGDERPFVATGLLSRLVADIETVVVNNEKEALLLENHLIKQHQPRFNVKLTDDKNYLVLRIDPRAHYPRVEVKRGIQDDGARYFGPYHSATSCRETLRLLNRHFQLRTCTDHVLNSRTRPCIQYQIKRCPAPCVFPVDEKAYAEQVDDASMFLAGKRDALVPRLRTRMKECAAELAYERAGQLRDQVLAVEKTLLPQAVVQAEFVDQDVIGYHRQDDVVEVVVLFIRQGKLLGRRAFQLREQEISDEEMMSAFVKRYYDLGTFVPDQVLVPTAIDDQDAIAEWLHERSGHRVEIALPQRGPKAKLLQLAKKNAQASSASRKSKDVDALTALDKLQKRLGLRRLPRRIECFDVAHMQGAATVASMVVFLDGQAAKSEYRKFKVKTALNDDFAAMYEVLSRRFRRAKSGSPGWMEPDLLVVDGGKGQLSTALAALRDVGLEISAEKGFDVIGLAKERETESGEVEPDRVFLKNVKDPIRLRSSSTELFLLARLRDEAHRVANQFHRAQRKKKTLRSSLEEIPGIGPRRKKALLLRFGSLKNIKTATLEELSTAPGMSLAAASAIKNFFGPKA